jgi:serine/threonine protein kinase
MAVFISGEALTSPNTAVHLHAVSTIPMPNKAFHSAEDSSENNFVPIQGSSKVVQDTGPKYIGNYRIIDQLGAGGMGIVYKAHHDSLKRMVALKVMRPDLARDQNFINRFLREGRAAATVDHPNVVPVYDAGFADGHLYQAMRYVPGGDLASLLHRSGTLPEDHAVLITLSCIAGLQAISDAGMIHRDLKPANILLEANGVPRLADLGLVRMVSATELSLPGSPQGTPHFMSPEQARAARDLDIRSDIYALGVTLFCMLCGQPPFSGDSPYDVVANVLYQPNPDPRSVQPGISAGTAALVMKAMAKLPEDRFQSLVEFQLAAHAVPPSSSQARMLTRSGKIRQPSPNNFWMRKLFGSPSKKIDGEAVTTQL